MEMKLDMWDGDEEEDNEIGQNTSFMWLTLMKSICATGFLDINIMHISVCVLEMLVKFFDQFFMLLSRQMETIGAW